MGKKKEEWDIDWEANKLGIDPKFMTNDDRFELVRLLECIKTLPEEERKRSLLAFVSAQHQRQIEHSETMGRAFLESPVGKLQSRRSLVIRVALGILIFVLGYGIFSMAREGFSRGEFILTFFLILVFFGVVRADGITLSQYILIAFLPKRFARKFCRQKNHLTPTKHY